MYKIELLIIIQYTKTAKHYFTGDKTVSTIIKCFSVLRICVENPFGRVSNILVPLRSLYDTTSLNFAYGSRWM